MKIPRPAWRVVAIALAASCAAVAQVTIHTINVGQAASTLVELPHHAVLIDAGGEVTEEDQYADHLMTYLDTFFASRADLGRTLDAIIITHPHIDHTKYVADVIEAFTVKNLIDGGDDSGSGIGPLRRAREYARDNRIHYTRVPQTSIRSTGRKLSLLGADAELRLLSGTRDCDNGNNNSITIHLRTPEAVLLFTGDSEADGDPVCDSGQLEALADRFGNGDLLKADVYHVAHHGSYNGTTDDFMRHVNPSISIISAG
jgi:competence protein ComEC